MRNSDCENLVRPLVVGSITLKNRAVMAPMTRGRADADHTPNELMKTYFTQRAGFGLILTDPTMIQRNYSAFGCEPGIYKHEQVVAWRAITDAVHGKGGVMFLALHHSGRATTASCLTSPNLVVMGPSHIGISPDGPCERSAEMDREGETQRYPPTVHQMQVEEIKAVEDCYLRAAKNAMAAGFDGVEIDGANGYLIDQFLRDGSNDRTDEYGGSIANRARLLLEVVDAVAGALGPQRVGVRLSPASSYNGMSESNPKAVTDYVCKELSHRKIAFIDLVREGSEEVAAWARAAFTGPLICGGAYTPETAETAIQSGAADAVAFATLAVANADLVQRVVAKAPLNTLNPATITARGSSAGYVDYPLLEEEQAAARQACVAYRFASCRTCEVAESREPPAAPAPMKSAVSNKARRVSVSPSPQPQHQGPVGSQTPAVKLLKPLLIHQLPCKNRMIMGPLPRQRADDSHNPTPAMAKYYGDRAGMGLVISEPVEIQPGYHTYVRGPCMFTKAQISGWRTVTDAVHNRGGLIFCQLHHGGRAVSAANLEAYNDGSGNADGSGRSLLLHDNQLNNSSSSGGGVKVNVIGASARPVQRSIVCPAAFTANGTEEPYPQDIVAMHRAKIQWLVKLYASAARKAISAGFDGVEIQASNGYLIDQFLRDGCNDRTDIYGGSIANRCRFLLEVVDAVVTAVGKGCVGVRVSPTDPALDMKDSNVVGLCEFLGTQLQKRDIAYLAVTNDYAMKAFNALRPVFTKPTLFVDAPADSRTTFGDCEELLLDARYKDKQQHVPATECYGGADFTDPNMQDLMPPSNDHYAPDAVTFLLPMVANPDLAEKAVNGVPLKRENGRLLFTHDEAGYNDYPTHKEERTRARRAALQGRERRAANAQQQQEREANATTGNEINRKGGSKDVNGKQPVSRTAISRPRRPSVSQPQNGDSSIV